MRIAVFYSRKRVEEKLITAALDARGVEWDRVDPRAVRFEVGAPGPGDYDAALIRCLSHTEA